MRGLAAIRRRFWPNPRAFRPGVRLVVGSFRTLALPLALVLVLGSGGCGSPKISANYAPYYNAGLSLNGTTPNFRLDLSERSPKGFRSLEVTPNKVLVLRAEGRGATDTARQQLNEEDWLWLQRECLRAGFLDYAKTYQGQGRDEIRIQTNYGDASNFSVLIGIVPSGLGRSLANFNLWLREKGWLAEDHFNLAVTLGSPKPLETAEPAEPATKEAPNGH